MKTVKSKPKSTKPFILGRPHEEILKVVYFYRYMTALDVTYRLYAPASLTYVRDRLSELAGGEDFKTGQYLYRFRLPSIGNSERVYTLGSKGRDFLANELGVPVDWYFRPEKIKHLSYGFMAHNLALTRFLVAAHRWSVSQSEYKLVKVRTSYELSRKPARVQMGEGEKKQIVAVIPDAWLLFEQFLNGRHIQWFPILLEIDRGTEYQVKFKQHIKARIAYIKSGAYKDIFENEAVTIAYATSGENMAYRQTRLRAMCTWTQQVLVEQHRENWAQIFRFHAFALEEVYKTPIFEGSSWCLPNMQTPVSLFM